MSRLSRRLSALLAAAVILSSVLPCHAAAPAVSASSYVLMEAGSGRILAAQGETEERAIASTTKIMTALVALEHASLGDTFTVHREHLKEGSSMYLREGETLTLEALLYGLMLPSGNDAAECIAGGCAGDGSVFVGWMNEKAEELGLSHTHFANPSGLDAEGHYSCALDLARITAAAMREPLFARLAATRTATLGERTMGNHNKLLGVYDGCIGGKTGYTGAAGRTLVTCAERDGLLLIAVTLHDGNDWADHTALYDYGFSAFHAAIAAERNAPCGTLAVRGGEAVSVGVVAERQLLCPLMEGEELTTRIELPASIAAPVRAGEPVGTLVALADGKEVARTALLAADAVAAAQAAPQRPAGFFSRLWARITQ